MPSLWRRDVMAQGFARNYLRYRDGWHIRRRTQALSYTPPQVKAAYGFPVDLNGDGSTIGIIELGGAFSTADDAAAMSLYGISSVQPVTVSGQPQPDPGGADVEVMLDTCVIRGMAPRAKVLVYFAPNTDAGFAAAINQAVNDGCDTISISWGAPEDQWSAASRSAMDAAFKQAVSLGVNCFAASGDNGSGDGEPGNHSDFPAASPWCIGCGGTTTIIQSGQLGSETVWPNTGGGWSTNYSMPAYQAGIVNGSARGVPDVAGPADPNTAWTIISGGSRIGVGGTSAVAPMWAAITALLQQRAGRRVGWLLPQLYSAKPMPFHDTITGSNGTYSAGPGYDNCTGLGTPDGTALLALIGNGNGPPPPPPLPPPGDPSAVQVEDVVDKLLIGDETTHRFQKPYIEHLRPRLKAIIAAQWK